MAEKYEQESGYGCLLTVIAILIFLIYLFVNYLLNECWHCVWLMKKEGVFFGLKFLGGWYGIAILIFPSYYLAIFPIGSKIRTHVTLRDLKKTEQIITTPELRDKCSPPDRIRLKIEWANMRNSLGLDMDWVTRQEEINNNVGYTPPPIGKIAR